MTKTVKIYIAILVLLLVGTVYIDATRPKPIDWTPNYDISKKTPLGLKVFDAEVAKLFGKEKIQRVSQTAYEFLEPQYNYDSIVNTYDIRGTMMYIAKDYIIDDESTQELLYFADHGNKIFISSETFPEKLMDSLKFDYSSKFNPTDSILSWVANPNLGTEKINTTVGAGINYFQKIDTLNTEVLAYQINGKDTATTFIRVPFGKGEFLLHIQPNIFTNFHLLKNKNYQLAEKTLAYAQSENIYWLIKGQSGEVISNSKLRYILSQPPLKAAWYVFLFGLLVFVIFNVKRKQRIVPIIKPVENTTVEFTKTIGNLYFQEGDHNNIIDKKIIYFLEKIRTEYLIDTSVLDENFEQKLQQKTGKKPEDVRKVVSLIKNFRKGYHQSIEADLLELNEAIEKINSTEKDT